RTSLECQGYRTGCTAPERAHDGGSKEPQAESPASGTAGTYARSPSPSPPGRTETVPAHQGRKLPVLSAARIDHPRGAACQNRGPNAPAFGPANALKVSFSGSAEGVMSCSAPDGRSSADNARHP